MCVCLPGSNQSPDPSQHCTQRTPTVPECEPPSPTNEQLSKPTATKTSTKGPEHVTSSGSKVPARDQKSFIPVKTRKISPDSFPNVSTVTQEHSKEDANEQRAADASVSATEDQVSIVKDTFILKSTEVLSIRAENKVVTDSKSSPTATGLKGKQPKAREASLSSPGDPDMVGRVGDTGPPHSPAEAVSQAELDQKPQTKVEITSEIITCVQSRDLPGANQALDYPTTDTVQEERIAEPSPARLSQEDTDAKSPQRPGPKEDLKNTTTAEESKEELDGRAEKTASADGENHAAKEDVKEDLGKRLEVKPDQRLCVLEIKTSPSQLSKGAENDTAESAGNRDMDENKQQRAAGTPKEGGDTPSRDGNAGKTETRIQEDAKSQETVDKMQLETPPPPPPDGTCLHSDIQEKTPQTVADVLEMNRTDARKETDVHVKENAFEEGPPSNKETERLSEVPGKDLNANDASPTSDKGSGCASDEQGASVTAEARGTPQLIFVSTEGQGADGIDKNSKVTRESSQDKILNEPADGDVCKQGVPSKDASLASNTEKQMETLDLLGQTTGSSLFRRDTNPAKSFDGKKDEMENKNGRTLADIPLTLNGNKEVFPEEESREGAESKLSKQKSWLMNNSSTETPSAKGTSHPSGVGPKETLTGVRVPGPNSSDVEKSADDKPKANCGLEPQAHALRTTHPINLSDEQKLANSTPASAPSPPEREDKEGTPSRWIEEGPPERKKGSRSDPAAFTSDGVDDFIKSIKEGSIPFSQPLKKHGPKKSASQLPAIKENHFEKTFDPEEFLFGLKKESAIPRDLSPAMILKLNAANRRDAKQEQRSKGGSRDQAADPLEPSDGTKRQSGARDADVKAGKTEPPARAEESGGRFGRMSILSNLLSSPRTKEKAASAKNGALFPTGQEDRLSHGEQSLESRLPSGEDDAAGVKSSTRSPLCSPTTKMVSSHHGCTWGLRRYGDRTVDTGIAPWTQKKSALFGSLRVKSAFSYFLFH